MDWITIEILNWDKYNPRKDLKATTWVRLQNSLFEDPSFFEFSHAELLTWIYLLSQCSKKLSGTIRLSFAHAERIARLKRKDVESAIEKLESLQCVRVSERGRNVDVTCTSHYERTNERDERNVTNGSGEHADVTQTNGPEVWEAYREAYSKRHGAEPTRNARVNSQIKQFLGRVPAGEAGEIAEFYVGHNDQFYVRNLHPVSLLLKDAEKLRTEWLSGRRMTADRAREAERKDHFQDQLQRVARGEL